jgi:hypothetical protein
MNYKNKFELQGKLIEKILIFYIFLNFFFPKISIFYLPGFSQGIRIENIVCFFMLITLIACKRLSFTKKDFKYLQPYLIFFFITILSTYIGLINEVDIQLIYILRILEFLVFCFLFFKSQITIELIERFIKYFFLMSILGIILQYFNIMGQFTSIGVSSHNYFTKYSAFTSGSWELAWMISLSYFIILSLNEHNKKKILIYFLLTLLILFFAGNRSVSISFLFANLVYFFISNKNLDFKISIFFSIILLFLIIIFTPYMMNLPTLSEYGGQKILHKNPNDIIENIVNLDFNFIYELLKEFFIYGNVRDIADTPQQYYSLQYRIMHWAHARDSFLLNYFTILFGSGAEFIYYDSTIVRIIFSLGIIGTLFFVFLAFRIPLYLLIFFLISGLTIDYIASYKLVITSIILHYTYTRNIKE